MRLLIIITIVMLCFWSSVTHSEIQGADNIQYKFIQSGNHFIFHGTTSIITSDPTCLIHILYDFKHLSKINSLPNSIVLLQKGEDWYEVAYHYRNLLFESKTIYIRSLKQAEKKVTFEMVKCEQQGLPLPKVVSSSGYYKIEIEKEGVRMIYVEEGEIADHSLKKVYFQWLEKEAVKFLYRLRNYVENTCH